MSNADSNRVQASLRKGLRLAFAALICLCLAYENTRAGEASAQLAREHLYAGTLVAGASALAAKVNADGGDREARFGLGLVSFARAVERFGQSLYRYGLTPPKTLSVPVLRFPVPANPTPEPISYQAFRDVLVPHMRPALIAGALLAFTLSLDDFVITFFTSGPDTITFPVKVYSMLRFSVTPEVNAASTMLILLTIVLMALMMLMQGRAQKNP